MVEVFNYKSLTLEQLRWAYDIFEFHGFTPYWHQLVCMAFAGDKNRIGLWNDPGTGKTPLSYWIAQQWNSYPITVVCPNSAINAWVKHAVKFNLTYQIISGETLERREKINQDQQVSIIQYEWLKTIYCNFEQSEGYHYFKRNQTEKQVDKLIKADSTRKVKKDHKNPGNYIVLAENGKKWKLDPELFIRNAKCVIFDEMHRCREEASLQSQICLELSKRAKYVIGLSGTPIDDSLLELFNIYNVLDLGITFGWDYFNFRKSNFYLDGFEWRVKKTRKESVMLRWAGSSLSFSIEECFDLPVCQEYPIVVQPTAEFRKLESRIITNQPIGVAGYDKIFPKAAHPTKLKQLTDGFIYLNYENKLRQTYRLKENPKLEAVKDLLEFKKKMIIFYEYQEVGDILSENLLVTKTQYMHLKGGITPEERIESEWQFQNNPDVQVALVMISAGAEGWDGFAAEMVVFWDIIPSPKRKKQCLRRMVRHGQTKKTLCFELILENTINEATKDNQGARKTEVQSYMDYIQNYYSKELNT